MTIPTPPAAPAVTKPMQAPAPVHVLGSRTHAVSIRPQSVIAQAGTAARVDAQRLNDLLRDKRVVVLAGPMMVTDLIVRSLEGFGARVDVINNGRAPMAEGVSVDLADEAHVRSEFGSMGQIDGIVNLLGFGAESAAPADVERAALHTFNVARAWFAVGGEPGEGTFFLSVTGMGGRLGFNRATGPLPLSGAVAGMTKSLAREWSKSRIKVVDVAREGFYPELGRQILDALFNDNNDIEVGVIGGVQWGPAYVEPSEIFTEQPSLMPQPSGVVLVTGGARGITSEILRNLSLRAPATYVIVGRTPFDGPEVLLVDLDQEKARIRQELAARGERVTPVAIQRGLARIIAQQEIALTVQAVQNTGSHAEYVTCDLADLGAVRAMVEEVRAHIGPITGFIHGAGIEESKLIHDKDLAGFHRVFRGKALGALVLWEATRSDALQFAVFFSSVAGRFGNIGQADYSAANECLNKLSQHINATSRTRALSIDWTAWDDVGMATEGSMKQILESRGIDLLPAAQGAPMLGDLLEAGIFGEVLVAGRLGDMFDGPVKHTAELATVSQTTEKATFERTISLDDPFMKDHIYDGTALLPGVMGLEFMHEAARLLGHDSWVASDVKFDKAIKLLRDEPVKIVVTAEKTENGVVARIETHRVAVTGRALNETHFEATFSQTPDHVPGQWVIDIAEAVEGPNHEEIYARFFHTGVFRVLERVALLTNEYVVAHGRIPAAVLMDGKDGGKALTQPLLTEMMFQAIGVWGMVHHRVTSLPNRIATWELFRSVAAGQPVSIRARKRSVTDTHLTFDAEVRDEFGHLVAFAQNIELIIHQPLSKDLAFDVLELSRGELLRMTDPEARAWVEDHGLTVDEMLGDQELESWNRFLSDRRRSEWFAARIAAKRGIAAWIRDVRGLAAHPRDIVIDKDANKAPFPTMRGAMSRYQGPLPHLSVSHSGGIAVVHVGTRTDMRIGVDLEAVEAREKSFATEYFTPEELALGPDLSDSQRLTALWTIKESVSKALGLGLHVRLSEIVIQTLDTTNPTWTAKVDLKNDAAVALANLRGEKMDVRVFDLGPFMLAEATFSATAEHVPNEPLEAPRPDEANMFAAVAALLHHKGLLKTTPRGNVSGR
ncbi:MAG: SDR family NAD(P)-dependent oxidoreductase [bacterium]